jgi:hypothetical protein
MGGWPLRPFSLLATRLNARLGVGEVPEALLGAFYFLPYKSKVQWNVTRAIELELDLSILCYQK